MEVSDVREIKRPDEYDVGLKEFLVERHLEVDVIKEIQSIR